MVPGWDRDGMYLFGEAAATEDATVFWGSGPLFSPSNTTSDSCTLLSGAFDYFVQFALALTAFISLFVKRCVERPRRPWKIFLFDTSKQAGGMAVAHFGNLATSFLFAIDGEDPCAWYLVNIVLDTTVRTALSYVFLVICEKIAAKCGNKTIAETGQYGEPPLYRRWLAQLSLWLFIVLLGRVILSGMMYPIQVPLYNVSENMLRPVRTLYNGPKIELVIVMVVVPLILNALQLLVQDAFIKGFGKKKKKRCCSPSRSDDESGSVESMEEVTTGRTLSSDRTETLKAPLLGDEYPRVSYTRSGASSPRPPATAPPPSLSPSLRPAIAPPLSASASASPTLPKPLFYQRRSERNSTSSGDAM